MTHNKQPEMPTDVVPNTSTHAPHKIFKTSANSDAQAAWQALAIEPCKAAIILSGHSHDTASHMGLKLEQLLSRGLMRAAKESQAVILDADADSGVLNHTHRGLYERCNTPLVGLSLNPSDITPLHNHLIQITDGQAQSRTNLLFEMVNLLRQQPVVMLLVNGNEQHKEEVLRAVRLLLPVIMVKGSGGLADTLADLHENPPEFIEDPLLAEIIADGDLHFHSIQGSVSELERLILRQLRGDATLMLAWKQFAIYNSNANRQQRDFRRLQGAILYLGVWATLLVLLQTSLATYQSQVQNHALAAQVCQLAKDNPACSKDKVQTASVPANVWQELNHKTAQLRQKADDFLLPLISPINKVLNIIIIIIPILISVLLAAANRFNAGSKWLLLRTSAEGIKREIFRYRAQAEIYHARQTGKTTREVKLAKKIQTIGHQLGQTEVTLNFNAYEGPLPPSDTIAANDDGLSSLNPERYLALRLQDQLDYYISKTKRLESKYTYLQWGIYIIGGLGTFFAAIGLELWIALTTAIVAALGTYLEYQQTEKTLRQYNQAAIDLTNVRSWWVSLSAAEQAKQSNIDVLVGQTEQILHSEFSGWMQDMQEALNNLKEQQSEDEDGAKSEDKLLTLETELTR